MEPNQENGKNIPSEGVVVLHHFCLTDTALLTAALFDFYIHFLYSFQFFLPNSDGHSSIVTKALSQFF
jgi:hypothetical protein